MAGKRRKRFWADDEKQSICRQTLAPGVSVAMVAQRYALNANLIFKWLCDPRFAPTEIDDAINAEPVFLPVEVTAPPSTKVALPSSAVVSEGRIKIDLAGGHSISAEGGFDPDVLARLLKGIMT